MTRKKVKKLTAKIMITQPGVIHPQVKIEGENQEPQEIKEPEVAEDVELSELNIRIPVYHHRFDAVLTDENVQRLIDILHQHEIVSLRLSTEGGSLNSMRLLFNYLYQRRDEIVVIFDQILWSGGFYLLVDMYGAEIPYVFDTNCFQSAMVHSVSTDILYNRKNNVATKEALKVFKAETERLCESLLNLGLEKSKVNKIKRGDDVLIDREDLKKLGLWKESL